MPTSRRQDLEKFYYQNKLPDVEILIDNVWDPHNVAAICRSCDGFGIKKINLYYTHNQFPDLEKDGKKSSSSSIKWLEFEKIINLEKWVKAKKSENFKFYGTHLQRKAKLLTETKFTDKIILIVGSEKDGMADEVSEICDEFIYISIDLLQTLKYIRTVAPGRSGDFLHFLCNIH